METTDTTRTLWVRKDSGKTTEQDYAVVITGEQELLPTPVSAGWVDFSDNFRWSNREIASREGCFYVDSWQEGRPQ